jgi:hypothetical protein
MFGIGSWTTVNNHGKGLADDPVKGKLAFVYLDELEFELTEVVKGKILHSQFLVEHCEGVAPPGFFVDDVKLKAAELVNTA